MDSPLHWLEDVWQDANLALRLIMRSPGFSFVAIATLAFGIAATAAIFSFVSSLTVRPLAIEDVGAVVQIAERFPGEAQRQRVAYANFSDWKEQSNSFEQIAAFRFDSLAFAVNSEPDQVLVMKATASIFPLLHARTAFGRFFTTDDDRPGAPSVAVLTHAFWQNHFGGDPNIIGQTARLDGHSAVVIGVLADDPDYFSLAPVWTPLALARGPDGRSSHFLSAVARLKSGVTLSQSRAELDLIASRLTDNKIDGRQLGVLVVPFQRSLVDFIYPALSVAMAAAGFLLLITCSNVGNLVLARGTTRGKEIAIRIALGASRSRIVRQLLAESAVLCCCGAIIGTFLCRSAVKAIVAMSPENQRLVDIQVDWRVVIFIVLVTALTSLALGLLPALRISQPARFARSLRLRNALIVAEVASALVLLAGTGLLLKSYLKAQNVSPGMRIDGILTVDFFVPHSKYPTNEGVSLFYSRVLQAMASVPGVQSSSTISTLPFAGRSNFAPFEVRGVAAESHDNHDLVNRQIVSANYFTTADVKVVAGRAFNEQDSEKSQRVAVINKALAERFWKDRDPIGTEIRIEPPEWKQPWLTIIGVSANVMHYGLDQKVPLEIYQPFDQVPDRSSTLLLQTQLDPSELGKTIRERIFEIDRDQAVSPVRRMKDVVDESLWQRRVLLSIMLLFGGIGLVLSSIALYGVIAYSVQRRQSEFGIRIALGARSRDILMLAMSEGLRLVAMGILIGLAVSSIAAQAIKSLLYDISTDDAATFGAILALLLAVSFIAVYLPARTATGADPVSALRID